MGAGRPFLQVGKCVCKKDSNDLRRQDDRHRSLVGDLHHHPRSEDAALERHTFGGEGFAEALVERLSLFGPGRFREARTVALGGVGDQRELADDECLAARVEEAPVELPLLVLEDPQAGDLPGEPAGLTLGVAFGDAEKDAQPRADLGEGLRPDQDAGLPDALNDRPQI
jgi:hypothetical protein